MRLPHENIEEEEHRLQMWALVTAGVFVTLLLESLTGNHLPASYMGFLTTLIWIWE